MSSALVVGGLAAGGCLPTDDLTEYSEEWSNVLGGSGGSGTEQPAENAGSGGAEAAPTGMQRPDGGPLLVDVGQGGLGGTSSTATGSDDAGLDAGGTGLVDAAPATLPDACADAAPGSCGS